MRITKVVYIAVKKMRLRVCPTQARQRFRISLEFVKLVQIEIQTDRETMHELLLLQVLEVLLLRIILHSNVHVRRAARGNTVKGVYMNRIFLG